MPPPTSIGRCTQIRTSGIFSHDDRGDHGSHGPEQWFHGHGITRQNSHKPLLLSNNTRDEEKEQQAHWKEPHWLHEQGIQKGGNQDVKEFPDISSPQTFFPAPSIFLGVPCPCEDDKRLERSKDPCIEKRNPGPGRSLEPFCPAIEG